jgi:DNA-binding Lrp family transcriptional regulator
MTGSSSGLNNKMLQLLLEYLKDSNRSDGEIAKKIGVSQPTVSRMKNKLLKDEIITHFSAIPDFSKMGYEILAFSFVKFNLDKVKKIEGDAVDWGASYPCIIFSARVEGMGMDAVSVTLHKTYDDYKAFCQENKEIWGDYMTVVQYFLVDLHGKLTKPFSFEYLADDFKP